MPPDPLAGGRRILVMRPDNIGDVILAGPLLRAVRRHAPTATLGLLASPAGAAAAGLLPWVDEVVEARPVWQDLGHRMPLDPAREQRLIAELAAGRWDATLIATSWRQTAWPAAYAAYLAGIPVRIGFAADFGGSVLSHPVDPPPDDRHVVRRNLALLEALGIAVEDDALEVRVPFAAAAEVERRLSESGTYGLGTAPGEIILVLPGASAPARRIEPERLGRAAAMVAEARGLRVVVAGTAKEAAVVEACLRAAPGSTTLGLDLTLEELAALVDASALVLCNNSAGLHLADALGRPVVAAYAGTDLLSQWAPRRAPAATLSAPVPCSPCYRITCPIGNACLDLEPAAIADRALELLDGSVRPARAGRRGGVACAA